MSGAIGSNQDVDIDLGRLASAVWERRRTVGGIVLLAAGAALAATTMMTPLYKGETRILIESRSPNLSGAPAPAAANDPVLDSLNITSQAELLRSADLIRQVVSDLKLEETEEFSPQAQSLLPNPLVLLGLKQDPLDLAPEDRVIKEFREKLQVYAVENSRVIAVEFSSEDPKLAASVPNRMAEVYLKLQSGAKLDTNSEVTKWLEPEIASLTEKVRQAEAKVAEYRASAGLFQTTDSSSFTAQQLNNISTELARVRAERANAEARAENVRSAIEAGRDSDMLAEVVGSQVIQRLRETEANVQAQVAEQSIVLLDNHPRLKGLRAQLAGIRQQISNETRKILGSLDSEAEVSRIRERQLMQQLNELKAASAKAGGEEVGLRALEREATAQRQLLETYLARYREAASRADPNAAPADARIISSAYEPSEPYFPKVVPIVVIAALASLILSAIAIMVAALFSGRALRPVGVPVNTAEELVPHQASKPAPAMPRPVDPVDAAATAAFLKAEEQLALSASLPKDEAFTTEGVANTLLRHGVPCAFVFSPSGDTGSTATVMLAREVAERDKNVILLDLTGSGCPTRLMAYDMELPGITDLLAGETAFGDAIHSDRLSEAHIIPRGNADAESAMRAADRLRIIIDALVDAYDLVLVECGAAEVEGLARLGAQPKSEIVLSVPGGEDDEIGTLAKQLADAGYKNLLIMSGGVASRRRAA
ncbi:exopolysaccharide transport family protein [Pseudorhizobium tarimense]|uniref:Exopolysaccharide transport family protein n=1 Tax=Pseudorhizobium tarimense TaxID=1079109 RepID=A0ABV2HDX8_9HYPH|nr:Wzz/FepE/Etk N-terminal domain-containing protein [Pseudorhizobium tarimense]MCJ8521691.1 Wzz/FepE/Etk N-terminal domain-containing protein [Pseudorhizobium tarimense]